MVSSNDHQTATGIICMKLIFPPHISMSHLTTSCGRNSALIYQQQPISSALVDLISVLRANLVGTWLAKGTICYACSSKFSVSTNLLKPVCLYMYFNHSTSIKTLLRNCIRTNLLSVLDCVLENVLKSSILFSYLQNLKM